MNGAVSALCHLFHQHEAVETIGSLGQPPRHLATTFEFLFVCALGAAAFVMGGEDASASRYPYLVSIRNNVQPGEDVHHCGGALISPTTVLTAAHCVDDFRGTMPEIHIGRYCQGQCTGALSRYNNFEVAQAKSVFVHPDWQPWNTFTGSDIAVYELTRWVPCVITISIHAQCAAEPRGCRRTSEK